MSSGAEKSYNAHTTHLKNLLNEKQTRLFHIKNKNCVNYQISIRTLDILEPFWSVPNSWLTIADYNGLEANYFAGKSQDVVASDISDVFLKEANSEGLIGQYREINVEKIDLPDNSFDYVSCRESYHHFPRPYMGLYEMIRVSKKACILIEPIDILVKMPMLVLVKNVFDRFNPLLINKIWKNRFSFETVGNYVYKISEREIEKVAMGIGLRMIAFKSINILTSIKENTLEVPLNKKLWNKLNRRISFLNFLCWLKIIPHNTLCCVVFKELPDEGTLQKMKSSGYKIIPLPKNPYLK
jgi:SAM-dependent methyltransferase